MEEAVTLLKKQRRTQEERSMETRELLLRAAVEDIAANGYASTTTANIAARAGVSRGALQYHFETKIDLIIGVLNVVTEDLNFSLDIPELTKKPIETRLRAVVDRQWEAFRSSSFQAVLNIGLAGVNNPPLVAVIKQRMMQVSRDITRSWFILFADAPCSRTQLIATLRLVMAAGRGYAVSEMFGLATRKVEDSEDLVRLALDGIVGTRADRWPGNGPAGRSGE